MKKFLNMMILVFMFCFITQVKAGSFSTNEVIEVCGFDYVPDKLPNFTSSLFNIIKVLVPIILIVMGMLDFTKAMMASDEDKMKKSQKSFTTRLLASIIIFLIMAVVQFVFRTIDSGISYKNGFNKCMNCLLNNKNCPTKTRQLVKYSCSDYKVNKCPKKDSYNTPCSKENKKCEASCQSIDNVTTCYKNKNCEWIGSNTSGGCYSYEYVTAHINNSSGSSKSSSMAEAFVDLAVSQKNDPSAYNGEKYWRFMGSNYRISWCAAFVSWNIANTTNNGKKLSDIIPVKSSVVSGFLNYFHNSNTNNIKFYNNDKCTKYKTNSSQNYIPKKGDLIFFDWGASWNGRFPIENLSHIGIVQGVKDNQVITIEGNASNLVRERAFSLNCCCIVGYGSWY